MGLETATKPSDLVATNPAEGDDVDEGNNHFWIVKTALKYLGKKAINEATTVTGTTGTAVAGQLNICTNAGAVTMTLPASPEAMDVCGFVFTNNGATNVLARNSQPIQSAASRGKGIPVCGRHSMVAAPVSDSRTTKAPKRLSRSPNSIRESSTVHSGAR